MSVIIQPTSNVNTPSLQISTTVLNANLNRQGWRIQNQDSAKLYICLGGTASNSVYHYVLKAGTGVVDGTGGEFTEMNGVVFQGAITCYSAGTPSYTVLEH